MTVQERLVDFIAAQASWREEHLAEYPDPRAARAASTIRAFALFVRRLPSDDPSLLLLEAVQEHWEGSDVYLMSDEGTRTVSRIGFESEVTPEEFPALLARLANNEFIVAAQLTAEQRFDQAAGEEYG